MTVQIRQKRNIHSKAMDSNNVMKRNAYPGAIGGSYLPKNAHGWVTGLTKEEQKQYEAVLGEDLSPRSNFWETFRVTTLDARKDYVTLNTERPLDMLKYKSAIASGIVAPNRESLNEPLYLNTTFYFYNSSTEAEKKKDLKRERNRLVQKLANFEDNETWLLCVNHVLGLHTPKGVKTDRLYLQLDERISSISSESELLAVKKVFETTPLDLQVAFMVSKAASEKILVYDASTLQYTFEGINWGSSKDQAIKKFKDPQYAENLQNLTELVLKGYVNDK